MTEVADTPTGTPMVEFEPNNAPASDWATDFDHADPRYNLNAPQIWDELRETCPVAHSNRYGGTWLPVKHADVRRIAYDTENFTSRQIIVSNVRLDQDSAPVGGAPPITSDPPFHKEARKLLLPLFRPDKMDPWESKVHQLCNERLDAMGAITPGETVIDAAKQYAQHIPVSVISRMLGFPPADDDLFRYFVHNVLEGINRPVEERQAAGEELDAYLDQQVQDHIDNPRDDLTGTLLKSQIFGQPLSREHVRGSIALLLIAGIDTTWSAIGSSLWHLAQNPDDRHRMQDEPELIPAAIEEMLRAYAPVTMARLVKQDFDFNGCPMKAEDFVLLPFPAANRDPEMFERADEVIIDREVNRHSAFGLGIHRCLGSNLARMELRIAVEEFLKRFRDFELADPDAVSWSTGQIRGPRTLPIRII